MKTFQTLAIAIVIFCCACSTGTKDTGTDTPIDPPADTPVVKLGAYYFGGWYENSNHLTPALVNNYPERRPTWGWITNTSDAMREQIDAAADAGLHFFSFCWYFNMADLSENRPANNAITLFANAPNKSKLKFCLLVANHDGYRINPQNWATLKEHWKKWFQDPSYLKVDGKPLIIFFDPSNLVTNFGSAEALKNTFANFKSEVAVLGLNGVVIAGCPSPSPNGIAAAENAGFDALTGYNYHSAGYVSGSYTSPVQNMATVESGTLWPRFANTGVYHIPVSTLNWDNRPWVNTTQPDTVKRFTGYSKSSVANAVAGLKKWILENPSAATKEKLGMLYAWNEYGEGGWLSPSEALKDSLLQGVKEGLKQ